MQAMTMQEVEQVNGGMAMTGALFVAGVLLTVAVGAATGGLGFLAGAAALGSMGASGVQISSEL